MNIHDEHIERAREWEREREEVRANEIVEANANANANANAASEREREREREALTTRPRDDVDDSLNVRNASARENCDDVREKSARVERENATLKAELAVTRRSRDEAKAARERVERDSDVARANARANAAEEMNALRVSMESRARVAEDASAKANEALKEALKETRAAVAARDALDAECASLRKQTSAMRGDERNVIALREERDEAVREKETAISHSRALERMLEESREEQFASAEESATLRRAMEELREERGRHRTSRGEGDMSTRDAPDRVESARGRFFTEGEIAALEEEKYVLLAELQDERRRRQEIQAQLDDMAQTQDTMSKRAASASRVAAVAEGEADDYREKMSAVEKATRAMERKLEDVERRLEKSERIISAVKAEIRDAPNANDEELSTRVRAFIERANRKTTESLNEVLEELQLLQSKAKDMNADMNVHEANADERVTKLVEVRDKLMEEMNAQTFELERLDEEIIQREEAHDASRAELSQCQEKLAASRAQNERLLEIIEEQALWTPKIENAKPHVTASAPATPVKPRVHREPLRADVLAAGIKPTLASIQARLLDLRNQNL